MRVPARLEPLVDLGVIDEVVRPLLAGKEAAVYLVRTAGELRVAKVYKEASHRSFRQRAEYTEGRRVKNSRSERAMKRKSKFGREQVEAAWRTAEVDVIYRLRAAGVRVPEPYDFVEGVLVMELISDGNGGPAPRLVDIQPSRDEARTMHAHLIRESQRMLCAGVVHGDLSDFNVLIGEDGPVIIDFPQAVDPANNRNAKKLFLRDVKNLTLFLGRFAPELKRTRFGPEMWALYEQGELGPETELTGRFQKQEAQADVEATLWELRDVEKDMLRRLGVEFPEDRRGRKKKRRRDEEEDDGPSSDWLQDEEPERPRRSRGGEGPPQGGEDGPRGGGDGPRGRSSRRRGRRGGGGPGGPPPDQARRDEPSGERPRRRGPGDGGRRDERSWDDGGRDDGRRDDGRRDDGRRDDGRRDDRRREDGRRDDRRREDGRRDDRRRDDGRRDDGRRDDRRRDGGRRDDRRRDDGRRDEEGRGGASRDGRSGPRDGGRDDRPRGRGDGPRRDRPGRSRRRGRRGGGGGPPKGPEVVVKGDRSRGPRRSGKPRGEGDS